MSEDQKPDNLEPTGQDQPLTVLIVDDEPVAHFVLREFFDELGLTVIGTAENGRDAIQKNMELRPSIITLDLKMPVMGGFAALKQIKRDRPEVMVIIASAVDKDETVIECMKLGALDYIVKPFEYKKVAKVFNRIIKETKS